MMAGGHSAAAAAVAVPFILCLKSVVGAWPLASVSAAACARGESSAAATAAVAAAFCSVDGSV